ncbi:unnamed protein product [Amoebophrya sp. A120]|nr:unnamed protein product [Amoebophrya sp. A120]|eukprot:GSA120T00006497001.1
MCNCKPAPRTNMSLTFYSQMRSRSWFRRSSIRCATTIFFLSVVAEQPFFSLGSRVTPQRHEQEVVDVVVDEDGEERPSPRAAAENNALSSAAAANIKVELVVFADRSFQNRYQDQLNSLRCFANQQAGLYQFRNFTLTKDAEDWGRNASPQTKAACLGEGRDAFFIRHCLLVAYLESKAGGAAGADGATAERREEDEIPDETVYVALDADIAARSFELSADPWVALLAGAGTLAGLPPSRVATHSSDKPGEDKTAASSGTETADEVLPAVALDAVAAAADVMFFERTWGLENHNELMAGTYMLRNNPRSRQFLRQWAAWEFHRPENGAAFSSADNGAIHVAVPEALGIPASRCETAFNNLHARVDNLSPYAKVIGCVREHLGMGSAAAPKSDAVGEQFERNEGILLAAGDTADQPLDRALEKANLLSEKIRISEESGKTKSSTEEGKTFLPSAEGAATETLLHPDRFIPHLKIRVLGYDQAWALDWWASNSKNPFGHGLKNMTEGRRLNWFSKPMLSCIESGATEFPHRDHAPVAKALASEQPADESEKGRDEVLSRSAQAPEEHEFGTAAGADMNSGVGTTKVVPILSTDRAPNRMGEQQLSHSAGSTPTHASGEDQGANLVSAAYNPPGPSLLIWAWFYRLTILCLVVASACVVLLLWLFYSKERVSWILDSKLARTLSHFKAKSQSKSKSLVLGPGASSPVDFIEDDSSPSAVDRLLAQSPSPPGREPLGRRSCSPPRSPLQPYTNPL